MIKKALHFGAGNIGRGFIAPELQKNGYEVIFADVNEALIYLINDKKCYEVDILGASSDSNLLVENVSAVNINDEVKIKEILETVDIISTSVGPQYVLSAINTVKNFNFLKPVPFLAFENKYRASSIAAREANNKNKNLVPLDAVVDKIVPPQSTETLNVIVESYGSIFIEDSNHKPLQVSDVVKYGNYENEFIKKLWLLNGLHLQLAYFGLANKLTYIHEIFENEEYIAFAKSAIESLAKAFNYKINEPLDLTNYCETILSRFSMPEVNDELSRVARNPIIKFSKDERFEYPLRLLIANNENIETFKTVIKYLNQKDFNNVDGFDEFYYTFQSGLEEFLKVFWKISEENIHKYKERLS